MTKDLNFTKNLAQPDPIPPEGIERAVKIMQDGRLFRYGEVGSEELEVSLLEQAYADYLGVRYVCGVNSGGCALFLALKALGVQAGDEVLLNAFTLAPVPGAIEHAGAKAVLVDINQDYLIDLEDLKRKAKASKAKVLLLSHMRGHIADMHKILELCDELGLTLLEDCAHTMGAKWDAQHTGTFGKVSCFSTQTFKHINSGEGGLIVTNDDDIAAKVILHSGSYMLFEQNGARPPLEVFERWKDSTANYSMRMSALVAAVLRPQLDLIDERAELWNKQYAWLTQGLQDSKHLRLPHRPEKEHYVASSIQFTLLGLKQEQLERFQEACAARGVFLKWFGRAQAVGFTSTHHNWAYIAKGAALQHNDDIMSGLFDMRIPLSLTQDDCDLITKIIRQSLQATLDA